MSAERLEDPSSLLKCSTAELLLQRFHIAWDLATIEGQLQTPTNSSDPEAERWRISAKTAAHYRRRHLAAINNAIAIKNDERRAMFSGDDYGMSVILLLQKMIVLYEAASALIETDEPDDKLWDNLVKAVQGASDVYLQHPASS